ncbi:MAG: hypothetical protein ACKO6Q_08420 [Bacteroidota bacterium]
MRISTILFSLLFQVVVLGQNPPPGGVQDAAGHTTYYPGNMPLVISVPHGGTWNLTEIKDRDCEGAVTVTDRETKELAFDISDALSKYHGMRPYLIVCNITRKDVDQNREINEGTCGNPEMATPWLTFHEYIDSALVDAVRRFGNCLYIDLHGHGHPEQRLEIGYLIPDKKLAPFFDQTELVSDRTTSLGNLLVRKEVSPLREWLFGEKSFGTRMAAKGFPSVPSQQDPYPKEGEKYFNGGYNTKRYTGVFYPNVFGWQIESNYKGVRDPNGRSAFAMAFSDVITSFIRQFSFVKMPASVLDQVR